MSDTLIFDASGQYLSGADSNLPTGNSPRTLEAWVIVNQSSGLGSVVEWGTQSPQGGRFALLVAGASGQIYFAGESLDLLGQTDLKDGNLHKVSVVFDGVTIGLYVDGVLDTQATTSNLWSPLGAFSNLNTTDNDTIYIGGRSENFFGEIRGVVVHPLAITPTLGNEFPEKSNDFVSYYDFSGDSIKAYDQTDVTGELTVSGDFQNSFQERVPEYYLSASGSINEGSTATFTLTTTNVAQGTSISYSISGVSSSDVTGGLSGSVSVDSNGQATISVPIVADSSTEGSETLTVTAQGASASTTINDTSITPVPTYTVSASSTSFNEGSTATFTLSTTNVAGGTSISYSISGVSASDVTGGSLSGSVNVGSNGQATISVPLVADTFTEGNETLTVTVQGQSASTTVVDSSTSPLVPTYTLTASAASVNEGSTATFTLSTTNVAAGTGVNYLISGVSEADVVGGALSGTATVNSSGQATISVPLAADLLTEGTETLRIIVSDQTATMSVADTSVAANSSTTNITNNVTNNITNNTNINSGNTTNVNSGNTTTTTNNVSLSFQKNITTYDASITNDASVTTTVLGNITTHEGTTVNNIIVGTDGIDRLLGYGGNDRFLSSKGDDVFDGGEGIDAVTFNGNRSDFTLGKSGSDWIIEDTRATDANEGTDTLVGVERLGFGDQAIALDTEGPTSAGGIYRLYKATFNREPDTGGLGYWIGEADLETKDAVRMAEDFTWSEEFQNLYGIQTTDNYGTGNNIRALIEGFSENVLGRTPDEGGLNFYTGVIESKDRSVGRVLAEISDSQENYDGTIELIANGIVFDPYLG